MGKMRWHGSRIKNKAKRTEDAIYRQLKKIWSYISKLIGKLDCTVQIANIIGFRFLSSPRGKYSM